MTGESVGKVSSRRDPFLPPDLLLPPNGINYGQGIKSINPFRMHLIRVYSGSDSGQDVVAHGFPTGLPTHTVLIIKEIENYRKPASGFIP